MYPHPTHPALPVHPSQSSQVGFSGIDEVEFGVQDVYKRSVSVEEIEEAGLGRGKSPTQCSLAKPQATLWGALN